MKSIQMSKVTFIVTTTVIEITKLDYRQLSKKEKLFVFQMSNDVIFR
jgi:hypothetical protein